MIYINSCRCRLLLVAISDIKKVSFYVLAAYIWKVTLLLFVKKVYLWEIYEIGGWGLLVVVVWSRWALRLEKLLLCWSTSSATCRDKAGIEATTSMSGTLHPKATHKLTLTISIGRLRLLLGRHLKMKTAWCGSCRVLTTLGIQKRGKEIVR